MLVQDFTNGDWDEVSQSHEGAPESSAAEALDTLLSLNCIWPGFFT